MTPDPGTVSVSVVDGIATVRFGHPKGNSLPGPLLARLARAMDELGGRDDVRVIVLRSEGTGPFCAGASFEELTRITDARMGKEFFMGFARLILAMHRCPKPIVTRVQGKVVGGGVGMVAASDYAIAVDTAAVRLSELAVGIGPFVVGPVIERRIGPGPFAAMAIDADWRDAHWAERHGLFARLVGSQTELDERVDALAATLARSNPEALRRIKQITWQGTDHWDRLLEERAATSGELVLSDYTREAIAAFGRK